MPRSHMIIKESDFIYSKNFSGEEKEMEVEILTLNQCAKALVVLPV